MIDLTKFLLNKSNEAQVSTHLWSCDTEFVPPLSGRVEINDYAKKIVKKATRFEAWSDCALVGLVAAYCNDTKKRVAHITSVSVLKGWTGQGIASNLLSRCIEHVKASGLLQITLEVASSNLPAMQLYEKWGFVGSRFNSTFVTMNLDFGSGKYHG